MLGKTKFVNFMEVPKPLYVHLFIELNNSSHQEGIVILKIPRHLGFSNRNKTKTNLNTKEPTVYQHFRDSKQQQCCVAQNSQSCFKKYLCLSFYVEVCFGLVHH